MSHENLNKLIMERYFYRNECRKQVFKVPRCRTSHPLRAFTAEWTSSTVAFTDAGTKARPAGRFFVASRYHGSATVAATVGRRIKSNGSRVR